MNQRKIVYGNQGQLVPDFYVNTISRAYIEDENLMLILATAVGIETTTEKYANEIARLIVPLAKVPEINQSVSDAAEYALQNKNIRIQSTSSNSEEQPKYTLGESLGLF